MEPTLNQGDGFIAAPIALAGSPEAGDVITYDAEELHDGGLVTHRIVRDTPRGYITQGDANPFTDQDGESEPPVKDAQIVAKALQINGQVVVIPHLGTAVEGIRGVLTTVQTSLASLFGTRSLLGAQGLGYLLFAFAGLFYVVDWYREGSVRRRTRSTKRDTGVPMRLVLVGFALLIVVGATTAMVAPGGTQEYGVVSAEFESERPDVIPVGESKTHEYVVGNGGLLPAQVYVEPASEGVAVSDQRLHLAGGEETTTDVTLSAPDETGYYRRYVVEHRYLAVLPGGVIDALYEFHPWAPIVVIDALLAGAFLALTLPFAPSGRVRERSRETGSTLSKFSRRLDRLLG